MILKKGVKVKDISTELLLALMICDLVYSKYGEELVVTSLNDGTHMEGSKHYVGDGADLRTRYFTKQEQNAIMKALRLRLSSDYDIVLEKDHIHLEYDPK